MAVRKSTIDANWSSFKCQPLVIFASSLNEKYLTNFVSAAMAHAQKLHTAHEIEEYLKNHNFYWKKAMQK